MTDLPPLWEHQARDIERYLRDPSLFNLSDPGTGKTRTCIEAIDRLGIPALVCAPKSILQCAWGDDIDHFKPGMTYSVAYASNREEAFRADTQVVITNHDAITWLMENPRHFQRFNGGLLLVDESTAYKNPAKARRTKAAMEARKHFGFGTCLTGTPTPQGLIDLWSQVYLVDQGERLGASYYRFKNLTYTPANKGRFTEWQEKPGMADAVAELIADITIRNRREDCLDLPPNFMYTRSTKLSPSHMKKYLEMKRHAMVELETGDVSAVNAAVLLGKLLQIASGAVYDEFGHTHVIDTGRYELVMDLVEERQHSVVVFNWRHQRDEMVKLAQQRGLSFGIIDGSVGDAQRTQAIRAFQSGELRALMLHPQSAAHGITLTRGEATIWCSPTHNAEHFEQANARIYRGGQDKKTETILVAAEGTADNEVYAALNDKRLNMSNLLEMLQ